ncbi:transcriptional Coactivator p15-domain-containing protein [Trichophaea hybrida]|nr:transcriptional Coactivator p15-domain-containing protein [Trichophaea hybrida]
MPPKKKRALPKYAEDDGFVVNDDSEPESKRTKTKATQGETGKKFKDDEGNAYWELGGRLRRVTVSKFKGKTFINIREHYEKDGKVLPGKKGISLNAEQFDALVSVLPQIEASLADEDIELTRPVYTDPPGTKTKSRGKDTKKNSKDKKGEEEEEEEKEEEEKEEEKEDEPPKQKKARKVKAESTDKE